MKKFWIWFFTSILSFVTLATLIGGGALLIMSGVHKHSVKDEFYIWFPALEKKVENQEPSGDENIVIEDETQIEEETGDELEEPSGDENVVIEDETQTE